LLKKGRTIEDGRGRGRNGDRRRNKRMETRK
jgi:hypothetical protein